MSDSLGSHGLCSLPGSSVHGIFQARVLEWGAIAFSRGIFPTQGLNPGLLHCRQTLYPLSHQGSPFSLGKCKSKSQCDTTSHLLRCSLSKNQKIADVDKDVETLEPLCPIDVKLCWWSRMACPQKIKNKLPYSPAILLLDIYSDRIRISKDSCILMFIAALFTIAKRLKNLNIH